MTNEESVEGCAQHHAQGCTPHLSEVMRWMLTEAYAQHVTDRLEERPRVLLPLAGILIGQTKM